MKEEKRFRFKDVNERYKRMNAFYIATSVCMWMIFLMYLLMKLVSRSIAPPTVYGNLFLIITFTAANIIIYSRNRASMVLKKAVGIGMGIEFLLIGMQTDAEFIYFALILILALQIPYYDQKSFKRFCIGYAIMFVLVVILRYAKHLVTNDVDSICREICVCILFFALYKIAQIAKLFSDHALSSAEDQAAKQKEMLDGIIDISKTVQDESAKSQQLVEQLVSATETVAYNMKEISSATNTTAQSIEEQNHMTHNIQEAISDTGERSRRMVGIATKSNESIHENIKVMSELKEQSAQISATNATVNDAMERLQNKTKEVEAIAGMILNISSQTNLLALNASIESARAGEAGRGFAVVAEQIRQLAEQTKNSTEKITTIVNELNVNSHEVVSSVENSTSAVQRQSDKIIAASQSFEKLNRDMTILIKDINEVDSRISGLTKANNNIVENISQLSAATEEVTATAEQVKGMSEHNLEYAEEVKDAISLISDKAESMKKYM